SSSINVANVTVPAITQGFTARRRLGFGGAPSPCNALGFSGSVATAVAIRHSSKPEMRPNGLDKHQIQKKSDRFVFFRCIVFRGRRMRKGEATRERIIATAAPIFNQHGYEGTSMQQLME